ncbi:MAG TPA: GNAT family protein [Anaeromyxobacteraceae bacterium]|nr:GNAT family protein [Anaeromyxobacteraceae bacterium]
MSYEVRAAPPVHRAWLEARIGRHIDPESFRGVEAVDENGRVVAMAGFEFWTESGAGVHVASDDHALRRLGAEPVEAVLRYAFETTGRKVLWALVAEDNSAVRRLAARNGFRETGRVRDGYAPGVDLVLLVLHREWR